MFLSGLCGLQQVQDRGELLIGVAYGVFLLT